MRLTLGNDRIPPNDERDEAEDAAFPQNGTFERLPLDGGVSPFGIDVGYMLLSARRIESAWIFGS